MLMILRRASRFMRRIVPFAHGAAGEGNAILGAPGFVDHQWLYLAAGQDKRQAIEESIRLGRNGVMPAQQDRLRMAQIRLLAAWLSGGIKNAPLQ